MVALVVLLVVADRCVFWSAATWQDVVARQYWEAHECTARCADWIAGARVRIASAPSEFKSDVARGLEWVSAVDMPSALRLHVSLLGLCAIAGMLVLGNHT